MPSTYLTQSLHRAARCFPDRVATVCGARRRTYGEVVQRVARLASGLRGLGLAPGDRVGILAFNSDAYFELYFAIWWAGGVVNPVNLRWSAQEIAYSLDDCETRLLVVDEHFAAMAVDLAERSQALRTILCTGNPRGTGMFGCEDLIADSRPMSDSLRANDDLAGIFYTGGTTGFPKGVMLSHANLWSSTVSVVGALTQDGDIGLHAAPMFHLADGMFLLALTMRGCTHVIVPGFQVPAVLTAIQQERVSNLLLVPTMIQMLVDDPRLPQHDLSSLRQLVYGASPISEALLQRAMQHLPRSDFVQAYGLTEMSPLVSLLGPQYHRAAGAARDKLRSAGQPGLCVEVRIVDERGEEVPRGTVGEIAARGPGVMQGYWRKPDQTASALQDGWLRTGDGAYMDQDGFLFVVDRMKDMIVSGGENVYSAEVENAVCQHPAVAACAVIGIPDGQWGEAVHAVVVCKPGATVDAEALRAHCHDLIAGYKCPRSIEFRESLPLTGAGKVLKNRLREPYWQHRERQVG